MIGTGQTKPRCLASYLENPRFSGALAGLEMIEDQVVPNPRDFACCQGTALAPASDGGIYRCDLTYRLRSVRQLMRTFSQIWGGHLCPGMLAQQLAPEHVQWLCSLKAGAAQRGRAVEASRERVQPGILWPIAFAAVWRFGFDVHVVTLGATKPSGFFPKEPQGGDVPRPSIFFVERVDKLWMPERAFDFETLVSWCDRAGMPLWVEFLLPEKKSGARVATAKLGSQFTKKVDELKDKPPLTWLQKDCLSRLPMVTDGLTRFGPKIGTGAPTTQGPARFR